MTSVAFQSNLRKQFRKLPKFVKFVKFVKIIQFYSILFNRVLSEVLREAKDAANAAYKSARENVTALEAQLREAKRTLAEADIAKVKAAEAYAAAEQKVLTGLSSMFKSFGDADSDLRTGDKATKEANEY